MNAEVKPGYKQTELGEIPDDWVIQEVQALASVRGGKRLPLGRSLVTEVTGHPYIRVTDMVPGGVDARNIQYVPEDAFPQIKNYRIFIDDIFISVAGTLGIVGKIPHELDGANLTENADRITAITCNRDFLLYNLMSPRIQGVIESEKTVGAQPKLALGRIESFQIAIPPNGEEQKAIASALSDMDALISSLDQLIAKKRDIQQAAMQQLLTGQRRLPGFSDEWEVKRLRDIAPLQRGFDLPNSVLRAGVYPVVYSNGIMNHHESYQAQAPGVVTGRSGTIGKLTYIESGNYWPHNTTLWVTSFKGNDPKFIFFLYKHIGFERFSSGSGVPTLNRNDAHAFEIKTPPTKPEQTAIANILSDMDTELVTLEARRDKARQLKQGMMQELLTGRTRLIDKESA